MGVSFERVAFSGSGANGELVVTMSALPESTVCCSRVSYGPFTLAAVCRLTLTPGYFASNSLSIAVIAVTAGGLTQVMILREPETEPPDEPDDALEPPPLEQAATAAASATAKVAMAVVLSLLCPSFLTVMRCSFGGVKSRLKDQDWPRPVPCWHWPTPRAASRPRPAVRRCRPMRHG